MRGTFGPGTIVLGGGALVLIAFLAVGFLLPGAWEAGADARLDAEPAELLAYLDSPEGWREWTTWPDSGLSRSGPDRGPGAAMSWDDRELGRGTFRIESVDPAGAVRYSVEVEGEGGSALRTEGTLTLEPDGSATLVRWREQGDLGTNPLMGYWALAMERAQGTEMGKSLERLSQLVSGS